MALLISDKLRVGPELLHQARMGSPHHLEVRPLQTNGPEPRLEIPPPDIVSTQGRFLLGGERPSFKGQGTSGLPWTLLAEAFC